MFKMNRFAKNTKITLLDNKMTKRVNENKNYVLCTTRSVQYLVRITV